MNNYIVQQIFEGGVTKFAIDIIGKSYDEDNRGVKANYYLLHLTSKGVDKIPIDISDSSDTILFGKGWYRSDNVLSIPVIYDFKKLKV